MAIPPAEQLWWGTGLENVLDFDYPVALDNPRAWRRPVPGSVQARNSAGVTDAAVYGYDYLLAGRARWFDRTRWDSPVGLQAFLDWAGQGNPFRFVPDKNVPDFYVDNCYLDSPFDQIEPSIEEADGSQSIDFVIRNATVPFGQALRGIMFDYAPGMSLTDPVALTFSRAAAASYQTIVATTDTPNLTPVAETIIASAASGTIRDRVYDQLRRCLALDEARTNLLLRSEALDDAAWTRTGLSGVLANNRFAPDAAQTADKLQEDALNSLHQVAQVITITAGNVVVVSGFFSAAERTQGEIVFANAGDFVQLDIDTANGTKVTSAGGVASVKTSLFVPLGNNWWFFFVSGIVNGAATAITCQYRLRKAGANTYTGTTGEGAYFWGTQGEQIIPSGSGAGVPFPTYYKPTAGATVTGVSEVLTRPWGYNPQRIWIYVDLIDTGQKLCGSGQFPTILALGTFATWRVLLYGQQNNWTLSNGNSTNQSSATVNPSNVVGDRVELVGYLQADAAARIAASVNGAADVAGGTPAAPTVFTPPTFGTPLLGIGNEGGGANNAGALRIRRIKIGAQGVGGITVDTLAKARAA